MSAVSEIEFIRSQLEINNGQIQALERQNKQFEDRLAVLMCSSPVMPVQPPSAPTKTYITEDELIQHITGSKIIDCKIKKGEKTISMAPFYHRVLVDIWKTMPRQKILDTTTYNFDEAIDVNGYKWCADINMTVQSKDSKGAFTEIINMANVNKLSIEMSIKLQTDVIVYFKM
jgi:hypothetical protein